MLTLGSGTLLQDGETALHRIADGARGCGSVANRKKAALALIEQGGIDLLLETNQVPLKFDAIHICVDTIVSTHRKSLALDFSAPPARHPRKARS